jgi:E3 ubiquitin-protein ligase DMA1/2
VSHSASPPTQSRPSRLRGLSYLRNCAQNHLSLHHHPTVNHAPQGNSLSRTTSSPEPSAVPLPVTPADHPGGSTSSPLGSPDPASSGAAARPANISPGKGYAGGPSSTMARFRPHAATQDRGSRRGRSVPPTAAAPETGGGSRLSRVASSNDAGAGGGENAAGPRRSPSPLTGLPQDQMPTIRFIPHQDPRSGKPSLAFAPTSRTLPHEDCVIRVGRYSERDAVPSVAPNVPSAAPVGFKSKVVSRRHCEFWCSKGQWYIRDVKSSSGTFLNHIRLSQPSAESRPYPVNDGDVVQLGIDYRGGEEQIFRCVKIRIECNRAWQKGLNSFKCGLAIKDRCPSADRSSSVSTHKQLKALGKAADARKSYDAASLNSSECSICLMTIAVACPPPFLSLLLPIRSTPGLS